MDLRHTSFDVSTLCASIHRLPHCSGADAIMVLEALAARVENDTNCSADTPKIVDALDDAAASIESLTAVRELTPDEARAAWREVAGYPLPEAA